MFNRKFISISIASVLLTSSLAVSANTQKDDDEDSVTSWGKWAQQYATAAGGEFNTNSLNFASLGQGETGRNGQNEADFGSTLQGLCEAGQVCAISSFYAHNPDAEDDQFSTNGSSGIKRMGNINGGQVIIYDEAGQEIYRHSRGGNSNDDSYRDINRRMDLDGSYTRGFGSISENSQPGDGNWFETVLEGGSSSSWGRSNWRVNGVGGSYVAGYTSSLAAVEALVGRVNLTYSGRTQNGASALIRLDLGAKSWAADFNKGAGDTVVDGRLRKTEFSVSGGTIDGINLVASNGQFSDGVTGEIQAAFFGTTANKIGGVIDVEKSNLSYSDSFVTNLSKKQVPIDRD